MATSCEELTHWKRLWCWEGLGAGGEGDDRGWDGWMASPTRWAWVSVNSGSWWWTGRRGMLRFMGSQRVGHDWVTELNWTDVYIYLTFCLFIHLSVYTWVVFTFWPLWIVPPWTLVYQYLSSYFQLFEYIHRTGISRVISCLIFFFFRNSGFLHI